MIPKIIHYVWLGGNDQSIKPYVKSWRRTNPNYHIMLWNEKNIDLSLPYLRETIAKKEWAHASNLIRLLAVQQYGGIYLDTDIKLLKSLDPLLLNKCFFGFQLVKKNRDWVNNAVFGAEKNHWFITKMIDQYLSGQYLGANIIYTLSPTITIALLEAEGLTHYSAHGVLVKDIRIYPRPYFYPYSWKEKDIRPRISPHTYTEHTWLKRWDLPAVIPPLKFSAHAVKLVMTLLVRDESDIVEDNICFHLAHGVDHIIAMDNNSLDGTAHILHKYEKLGVLTYLHQPDNTYEQSKWVSQMASLAVEKQGATHLFHADADEFWYPDSGNLKDDLPANNQVYYVNSLSYLPPIGVGRFLGIFWVVNSPIPYFAQMDRELSYRYLLYRYQPKVMTSNLFTHITQGNHNVITKLPLVSITPPHILIHHFPVRSYRQFRNKVVKGGESYLHHPHQDPSIGWQWKEWYRLYRAGLLRDIYRATCLTSPERKILYYRGIIKRIFVPQSIRFAKWVYWFGKLQPK
ncbi:MAG: glycosyltransferase [bacterium]